MGTFYLRINERSRSSIDRDIDNKRVPTKDQFRNSNSKCPNTNSDLTFFNKHCFHMSSILDIMWRVYLYWVLKNLILGTPILPNLSQA